MTWVDAPSDACGAAQLVLFDGYLGSDYLRVRALSAGSQTLVCYRVVSAASGDSGGNISISAPSVQVGAPTFDGNYQACQAAGNPPAVAGQVLGQPVYLDTYTSSGTAWVCVQGGPLAVRIVASVPAAGMPSVAQTSDLSGFPVPPAQAGPAGFPSSTCQSSGGASNRQLLDANVADTQAWFSVWEVSSSQVDICARVAGATAAGAMISLTLPTVPSLPGVGLQPVFETSSSVPPACTNVIAQFTAPTSALIATSAPSQANPTVVCVSLGGLVESVTVGITGSPTVPPPPGVLLPTISLDPGTP